MKARDFTAKEKREFNACWLALKERGFASADCSRPLAPGQFSTRWIRGVGYVVNWRDFA